MGQGLNAPPAPAPGDDAGRGASIEGGHSSGRRAVGQAQNGVDSRSGILQTPKELVESPFPLRNQTWKERFCSWTRKPKSYPYP